MLNDVTYRGRTVNAEDVGFIRGLIAANPKASRRALSFKLCEAWGWNQANGVPRDMVCRGLLVFLERLGRIKLPPARPAPPRARRRPPRCDLLAWPPVEGPLGTIRPLEVRQVRRTGEEPLFESLVETHHYLGYVRPVGEHLKYLVFARGAPIACMAWSSAPHHLGPRDRFIGWSPEVRRRGLHLVAYNPRFVILPWVHVPHLASHLLSVVARRISRDWEALYCHPIHFLETFVDPERFRGTTYRAANWILLGRTTGRGKDDLTHRANRSLKEVWGYPLSQDFRERLCAPDDPLGAKALQDRGSGKEAARSERNLSP